MLHAIQFAPFPDAARQQQYEALEAALAARPEAPTAVLLGNLEALAIDALLLQPNGLVLVLLAPGAGRLHLPAASHAPWLLDGQPLPGWPAGTNPLASYQTQLPAVRRWVAAQLQCTEHELPPSLGLAVFEAPLTFDTAVEPRLYQAAPNDDFELLGGPERVAARLRTLPAATYLNERQLTDWATHQRQPTPLPVAAEETPADYLKNKLHQLWQWLGAADVPPDPPYGAPAYPTPPDGLQEQARLQAFRQELQAELRQHRQEAAAREAAYQQELLRLQQQVLQAGSAASAHQSQAAETARLAAQAELEARTQELNQRIQQLGQLIGQLQTAPAAATTQSAPAPRQAAALPPAARAMPPVAARPRVLKPTTRRTAPAKPWWQQLPPAQRWALLGTALLGVGLAAWKLGTTPTNLPARPPVAATHRRPAASVSSYEAGPPPPVYIVDSSLAPQPSRRRPDTAQAADPTSHPSLEQAPDSQQVAPEPVLPDSI